jgi:predicted transposase/invertase (TIGR01784 family)
MQYEAREKAIRDHEARMTRARSEGIEVGRVGEKREIAEKLLKLHAPLDMILEATNLSLAEIKSLQAQMA